MLEWIKSPSGATVIAATIGAIVAIVTSLNARASKKNGKENEKKGDSNRQIGLNIGSGKISQTQRGGNSNGKSNSD